VGQRTVSPAQFGALLTLPHSAYAAVLKVIQEAPDKKSCGLPILIKKEVAHPGLDSGPQYDIIFQGTHSKSEKVHFVAGVMIFSFHLQTIYIDDSRYLHD